MRFDPAKSYPHPVLRPGSTDYPHAEFQVELELDRPRGGTILRVRADFEMSDPDLLALVAAGQASYVLRVLAPKTHFRQAIISNKTRIEKTFKEGQIHGPVVCSPFLVCRSMLRSYSGKGWHTDYASLSFDLEPGSVLAEDQPKEYWVDDAEEAPATSIFVLRPSPSLNDGMWRCLLLEEKVVLEMSTAEHKRFCEARERVNGTADASYVMNGIYLPALIWVLEEADKDGEEQYSNFRWLRVLKTRLSETGCAELGATKANRLMDAQTLLRSPFGKMPLLAEKVEE